jgi:competence protein ComEC
MFGVVMIGCLAYALMSGFTVPTRRALLMIAVLGWALLQGWHISPWRSLLLALTVVLIADPFSPLDAGFWLSFCAVAVLILVFSGRLGMVQGVLALVLAQTAMFAGLWPGLLLMGQNQPLAGFVANLFAIPWVSMVVMPLLLCGALLVALVPASSVWVTLLLDTVLGVLWQGLQWLGGWGSPTIQLGVAAAIGLAAVVLLALWYPQRGFRLTLVLSLGLWSVSHGWLQVPVGNRLVPLPQVIVWDVGQGLSVLVRHQQQALLYDTGPAIPGVFSAVESVILPNLRALGVQRLDTLVVSHADGDHSGGLELLVTELPPARLIGGEAAETADRLAQAGLVRNVTDCGRQTLMLGRLELNFWRSDRAKEGNGASCVLRIRDPESATEWLLTGDITVREEAEYLSYLNDQPVQKARNAITRVLLAPHHGSKSSSSDALVQALSPDTVIYTAGYRHRYGHPHPQVTRRYQLEGSHQINTACAGAVVMAVKSAGLVIRPMQQNAPFWISGPGLARAQCLERLHNITQ